MSANREFAKVLVGIWEQTKSHLNVFIKYAKVELTPPKPNELPLVAQGIKNILNTARTGQWKQITVKEAFLNMLVATEVGCWFYIGECIGKMKLIGYEVKVK